ncbi:MAG: ribosome-associated translation inhibitor RaiA [Candidatus Vogelbacteria bacterium]|nr:ribosome-associated translation inhibitor RaiA [Candidatus Vogelbacteria bacterium]
MKLSLKATGLVLTSAIEGYVNKRLIPVGRFVDVVKNEAFAMMEIAKTTRHHKQDGEMFRADVTIKGSGASYHAEATADDLYAAIDDLRDEILEVVKKRRTKQTDLKKRGGREVKKMLRG